MPAAEPSHPDRRAATLANLEAARASGSTQGCARPGPGSADCRIDLKLWQWRADRAAERTPAARAHLDPFPRERHPDLWAGTVQDGTARGFAVRLEEACSLASPDPFATVDPLPHDAPGTQVFVDKQLRRKKDILVASGGARLRFSRKGGLLFVDRGHAAHSENFLWFDAVRDHGTLDGFVGALDERPRLFSAQFLTPQHYLKAAGASELALAGRLGRGPIAWPCRIVVQGFDQEPTLRLRITIQAAVPGWRLRARFLGVAPDLLHHACMPVREIVESQHAFVADTMLRSCATLLVDEAPVAVPAAADPGCVRHDYLLGIP